MLFTDLLSHLIPRSGPLPDRSRGDYFYTYIKGDSVTLVVAPLLPLGCRDSVSVTPSGFCGGQIGILVGFTRIFTSFTRSQISSHHFSAFISFVSFHFIRTCDGASSVVDLHPSFTNTFTHRIGASSLPTSGPSSVWDTS